MPTRDFDGETTRSPHIPISRETCAHLDTGNNNASYPPHVYLDASIFDKSQFLSQVLQHCSWKQLEDIDEAITQDIAKLATAKKTMMSENYGKFLQLRENLVQTVKDMTELYETLKIELSDSSNENSAF